MKTLPLLFASSCWSVAMLLAVEPALASEPATTPTVPAADQAAKQDATEAAAATEPKSPAPAAADKDDSAAPGGKVPSPADVAKSSAGKGTPQRFTPSEQVRPDFDVSFPIDI